MNFYQQIPTDLINFLLVTVFALLIGLEQRRHYITLPAGQLFGTDRTFTLLGILGFILYVCDKQHLWLFMAGFCIVGIMLAGYYYLRISISKNFGITSIVIALITYCLAPLIYLQPHWLVILIVVCILLLTELKETFLSFTKKFDDKEFITLAVFLTITGVVLPLLPDKIISAYLPISPYRFWLALIVVSAISYISYLLQKFVFPNSGMIVTAVLGGLYSSTATTVILARKSREDGSKSLSYLPAIFIATTMMFLRIFVIALIFSVQIARMLAVPFLLLTIISLTIFWLYKQKAKSVSGSTAVHVHHSNNPLEFKIALIFASLFVFFAFITSWVLKTYGSTGIYGLSFIVGVTDIDPFILNLLQSKWQLTEMILATAILNATTSNNLLKMIYALVLSEKHLRKHLLIGWGTLILSGIILFIVLLHF